MDEDLSNRVYPVTPTGGVEVKIDANSGDDSEYAEISSDRVGGGARDPILRRAIKKIQDSLSPIVLSLRASFRARLKKLHCTTCFSQFQRHKEVESNGTKQMSLTKHSAVPKYIVKIM